MRIVNAVTRSINDGMTKAELINATRKEVLLSSVKRTQHRAMVGMERAQQNGLVREASYGAVSNSRYEDDEDDCSVSLYDLPVPWQQEQQQQRRSTVVPHSNTTPTSHSSNSTPGGDTAAAARARDVWHRAYCCTLPFFALSKLVGAATTAAGPPDHEGTDTLVGTVVSPQYPEDGIRLSGDPQDGSHRRVEESDAVSLDSMALTSGSEASADNNRYAPACVVLHYLRYPDHHATMM